MRSLLWTALLVSGVAHAAATYRQPLTDPVTCLAQNVYYEAEGEPWDGKVAVAQVTLNRANGDVSQICAKVFEVHVNQATGKKVAAFSWTLGRRWRAKGFSPITYAQCVWIAEGVIHGLITAPRIGANVRYYHNTKIHPDWTGKVLAARIGHHLFYRGD